MRKRKYRVVLAPDETIGHFGKVRLVRRCDGKHELIGGTLYAREAVRKWCDYFAGFLAFAEPAAPEIVLAA